MQSRSRSSRTRNWLIAIIVVAGLLRVGAACGLQFLLDHRWHRDFLIEGDAEGYWLLAQQIVKGEDYAIHNPPRYALRMPGFPALLAIPVALFGPSLFAARLFLAGIGTLACALTYLLGKRLFNERVGLIAAGLTAISPTFIVFSVEFLCETAFAVMVLWSLISGHRVFQLLSEARLPAGKILLHSHLTGLAIAAGVYQRPSWILAAPIVAGLLLLTARPGRRMASLSAGVLIVVGMVLVLLPWGIRNQVVTGHFTLTTFWMGPSLYDGLNPDATGDSNMEFYDRNPETRGMSEFEVDQYYRAKGQQFALENPGRTLELAALKAVRYWKPWPNAEQFRHPLAMISVSVLWVPMLLLAGLGAVWLLRNREGTGGVFVCSGSVPCQTLREAIWSVSILAGPIFYFAILHLIFVSSLRYRLPVEYPLLVLAALGIVICFRLGRGCSEENSQNAPVTSGRATV